MSKNKGQGKGKAESNAIPVKVSTPDAVCFYCSGKRFIKRDCQKFREEQKAARVASTSGIKNKQNTCKGKSAVQVRLGTDFAHWIIYNYLVFMLFHVVSGAH